MKTARLFLVLLILSGCTEKGKPVIEHAPDQRQFESSPASKLDAQGEVKAISSDINVLASRVLSEARIRNMESYSNRNVHDELISLNEKLIRTPVAERGRLLPILKNYVTLLQLECSDIKASCLGLKYFKMAGSSAEVAKMAAQMPEFDSVSARLLLFAVELKNGLTDNELLRLLVDKVPASNPTVRSMLETALMSASESMRDQGKLREFLGTVTAWDLIENSKWNLSSNAQTALLSMIARARLMYDANEKISPEFLKIIEDHNKNANSLAFAQKQLLERKILIPEALGVTPIVRIDELYFIIDAVFLQKISPQGAAELFHHSRRSAKDLAAAVENYTRMRFVLALANANVTAKAIFTAAIPTEQLLIHAMRQSSLVRQIWGGLGTSLDMVRSFASASLKQAPDAAAFEAKMRATFNSFGRSVNLASTYPHTLLLFQMLSQKRFKLTLRGLGEMDTGALMPLIFHGSVPPLLNYSEESTPLNHFEIMHSFDMAVRTNLFETMEVDPDLFISDVLSRLNQVPVKSIETTLDEVEKRYVETKLYRDFENICRELKGGPAVSRTITLEGIRRSPFFGSVMDVAFTGVTSRGGRSSGSGALAETEMGLFYPDGEYGEALERVRLDIRQHERVAQAMLTSYTGYLKNFKKLSDNEIAQRTSRTRASLDALSRLRQRAIKAATDSFERIGWCFFKAGQKDYDMMNEVIKMEEEHLRAVYRDMRRLREENLSEEQKQAIIESHQFKGLPSNFKGLDRVDKDAYTISSVDFLIRAGRFMQRLAPNIQINWGSRLDMDVELVRDAVIRQLPFTDTEEAFVESGLKAYFAKRDPFAVWQVLAGGRIITWTNYLKVMMTGYRLENEFYGKPRTFTAQRILQAHEEILALTVLQPDDRRLFAVLREYWRFDPIYLDERIIRFNVDTERGKMAMQDIWGLFDLPLMLAQNEKLGYDYDQAHMGPEIVAKSLRPKRFGYRELGLIYYTARSATLRGSPVIPYNADLDKALDKDVTDTVREGFRATKDFEQATLDYIRQAESRPPALRPRADVNMGVTLTSLLSDNLLPSFNSEIQQFRQSTQSCFVSKCEDFK